MLSKQMRTFVTTPDAFPESNTRASLRYVIRKKCRLAVDDLNLCIETCNKTGLDMESIMSSLKIGEIPPSDTGMKFGADDLAEDGEPAW